MTVAHQRCFHHDLREAVARCPSCRNFFCRECITEHDDRVICAACLKKLRSSDETRAGHFGILRCLAQAVAGLMIASLFFYVIGQILLAVPSRFHEGTFWKEKLLEQE